MANEDFTTYTLQNSSGNEITVTPSKVDVAALPVDEECYVQKDFGIGYFGNFVIRLKFTWTSATADTATPGQYQIWAVAAGANFTYVDQYLADDGFLLKPTRAGAAYAFTLYELNGKANNVWVVGEPPLTYWIEVERDSTNLTAKFYSDAFSTLVHTMSLSGVVTDAMRYLIPTGGYKGDPSTDTITGFVENYNIVSSGGGTGQQITNFRTTEKDITKMSGRMAVGMGKES